MFGLCLGALACLVKSNGQDKISNCDRRFDVWPVSTSAQPPEAPFYSEVARYTPPKKKKTREPRRHLLASFFFRSQLPPLFRFAPFGERLPPQLPPLFRFAPFGERLPPLRRDASEINAIARAARGARAGLTRPTKSDSLPARFPRPPLRKSKKNRL